MHPPDSAVHAAADVRSLFAQTASRSVVTSDPDRARLIDDVLEAREAIVTETGALATWNPKGENGRIPDDTYLVRDDVTETTIDWSSSYCNPMMPETFDRLWSDALNTLHERPRSYVSHKSIGADAKTALPVHMLTDSPLAALFADNMFRPSVERGAEALLEQPFLLVVLPFCKLDSAKYESVLRKRPDGLIVPMVVATDCERRLGIVYGSRYCGCIKKLMFGAMNYALPDKGILPLHCSANEAADGTTALYLGLSGTGKTTVSTVPDRKMVADDEVLWSERGIANMENGCYAKLIDLKREKEPSIFDAAFTDRPVRENGVIIENALAYPDGSIDLADARHGQNSRASYPLRFLQSVKESSVGSHPSTIILLTADAHGVLPPVAKLDTNQALLWFMMGYTCKLAGTEAGVTTPKSTFSRFFGGPFMFRNPGEYVTLFRRYIDAHSASVFLVNTGWTGGPYGTGERIDIAVTRRVVDAALAGEFDDAECEIDPHFRLSVPVACDGVDDTVLQPRLTWESPSDYDIAAKSLATEFATHFQKEFGESDLSAAVASVCPGIK